jgi:hypothetical protein
MPQKRGEVDEKVDAIQIIPDIYENWLKKQVEARSGLTGNQAPGLAKQKEEDKEEDEIDDAEDVHEKAHRRKRGKTTR